MTIVPYLRVLIHIKFLYIYIMTKIHCQKEVDLLDADTRVVLSLPHRVWKINLNKTLCLKNKLQLDILPSDIQSDMAGLWPYCLICIHLRCEIMWWGLTSFSHFIFLIPFPLLIYLLKLISLSLPLNRPIITIKLYYSLSLSCLDTCTTFAKILS